MRRRLSIAFVALAALGIATTIAAAVWYTRPIRQAREIGVDWHATLRASHCVRRPGEAIVWCTTMSPPRPEAPAAYTTLNYIPRRRQLVDLRRTRLLSDSSAWSALVDSTRRALAKSGREPLPCDAGVTHFRIAEAWRAGDHEIRLYAEPAYLRHGRLEPWFASIQLRTYASDGCGPRYVRRLLTPDEMAQRVQAWVMDRLGL